MRFSRVQQISESQIDAAFNDDQSDVIAREGACVAWVIDGATSVADHPFLEAELSDPAWYARTLSDALRRLALDVETPRALHARAAAEATQQYEAALGARLDAVPLYARPSASIVLMRIAREVAQLFYLGDCPGFALSQGGQVQRLTDQQRTDGEADLRERVRSVQARRALTPKQMFREHVPWLQDGRRQQLQHRPLDVSAAIPGATFGGHERTVNLEAIDALVLMSDGYERYTAQYGLGSVDEMVRATVQEGAHSVLARMRAWERADAACRALPRLKASDDATCMVLRRTPE